MRVLILNGSPRPNGNTKQMIRAFCEGLEKAGHAFDELDICRMNVHGCLACEYCHGKGNGQCVQKDDMGKVYHALGEADMLVIASPIYYHGLTGQLKCCIDRFYATLYPKKAMKLSKIAMLLASGDADMYDGAMFSYIPTNDFMDDMTLYVRSYTKDQLILMSYTPTGNGGGSIAWQFILKRVTTNE